MLCEPLTTAESPTAARKAELSLQGDDFTRQMWQMYAIFEDLLERQTADNDPIYPYQAGASSSLPSSFTQHFNVGRVRSGDEAPSHAMLASALATAEGTYLHSMLDNCSRMAANDYDMWSALVGVQRELNDDTDDEDDGGEARLLVKPRIRSQMQELGKPPVYEDSTTEFDSDELLEMERQQQSHHSQHYLPHYYQNIFESAQQQPVPQHYHQQRSVRRHRHRPRRRLPATPTTHSSSQVRSQQCHAPQSRFQHRYQDYFTEELTRSSPSVNTKGKDACSGSGGDSGDSDTIGNLISKRTTTLPYRRSSAPELLDNPLLETISTIENLCESDEYGELPSTKGATPLLSSNNSSGLSVDKDGTKTVKTSEASSSAEDKAQHSSDGDRDSVGYAGSNSVDSGYKSSCPTPELLDPCYYAQDALCNGSKRLSVASRASREMKPRIPMGTKVIGRHSHPSHQPIRTAPASVPWTTLTSNSSTSTSPSSGTGTLSSGGNSAIGGSNSAGASTPNRPEYGYYDVNLDHLMYLRQSLLSAIQRCGGSASPAKASPDDSECSGCPSVTSATTGNMTVCGSAQGSPIRSRSGSRTSRGSPDPQKPSPSSSPQSSQVRNVRFKPEAGRNIDLNVNPNHPMAMGSTNSSAAHVSPYLSARHLNPGCTTSNTSDIPVRKKFPADFEEDSINKSCSVTVPTLEEEIDTLLYGKAEYYDLESVQEFPCSYGTMLEHKYRHSSLAKVKKLKDSIKDPEPDCFLKELSQFQQSSSPPRCATGSQVSSITDKLKACESSFESRDNLSAATTSTTDVSQIEELNRETSSQGQLKLGGKEVNETCTNPEKDSATMDKARFSEVAKCMLKIIEDIQHQQQNGNVNGSTADSKTQFAQQQPNAAKDCSSQDRGNPNVATTSQSASGSVPPPAFYDSQRLSGADYHVYEEITYDLAAISAGQFLRETAKGMKLGGAGGKFKRDDIPPPLPARPNEIFGGWSGSASQRHTVPFGATSSIAGHPHSILSGTTHNVSAQPQPIPRNPIHIKRRGNFYSLFTEQSERRHLSQSLEREWQKSNGSGNSGADNSFADPNDDEYGFKAVKKPPPQ